MTSAEVLRLHADSFSRALQQHDVAALEAIYSDRYMLIRPDGSVFSKEQVLKDLIEHKVAFHPIELTPAFWRGIGPRLTVSVRTVAHSTVGAAGLRSETPH